jgi:prevent-host-death family protein
MATVTALEAKTRLGQLLDRVSRGEEIVITRYDKPIARIIPQGRPARAEVREAVNELHTLHREMARRRGFRPLTAKEIRQAIEHGRS